MKGSQNSSATHGILITGHHPNGKLDLQDVSGNDGSDITVNSDDDIVWTNQDPGITIDSIEEESNSDGHFRQKPASGNNWRGKVNSYNDKVHVIKYSINWTENGEQRTYDPLIRINPS
jgi:hypothetical protein